MQKFLTMNRDSTQLCLTSKRRDLRKRKNLYCCEKEQEKCEGTHSASSCEGLTSTAGETQTFRLSEQVREGSSSMLP